MRRQDNWTWTVVGVGVAAAALLAAGAVVTAVANLEPGVDLTLAGLAVGVIAWLAAAIRRPSIVDVGVGVEGSDLVVRFKDWDVLWTMRREVRIPAQQVTSIATTRIEHLRPGFLTRRRGTAIPGVIRAGSFRESDGRELWDVRSGGDVVWVELKRHSRSSARNPAAARGWSRARR